MNRFRTEAVTARGLTREFGPPVEVPKSPAVAVIRRMVPPSLEKAIGRLRAGRVPVRLQSDATDCGPAALAMVLAYHGIDFQYSVLKLELDAGRDGVSARALLDIARRHGLSGRGVRVTLRGLQALSVGSVLFWNFNHFVVLERATAEHVYIVDPALGRRRLPIEAASQCFTGVALEFQAPLASSGRARPRRRGRPTGTPWHYLRYFFPRGTAWVPLSAYSLALVLFNFVSPFASIYVVDQIDSAGSAPGALVLISVIILLGTSFFFLQFGRGRAIVSLQALADQRVTIGVFNHLLSLPAEFFARRMPADLASRVRSSVAVRHILTNSALSSVFDGVLVVIYLLLLLIGDIQLALVVMAIAALEIALLAFSWRPQQYLSADLLENQARAEGELLGLLEGMPTLKAAGLEGVAGERWNHTLSEEINARARGRRHLEFYTSMCASLQFLAPVAILAFGAYRLAGHSVSVGTVIGFSTLAMGIFVPLSGLILTGLQFGTLGGTLARLADVLEAEPEGRGTVGTTPDVRGAVELRDVCYTYPGSKKPTLKNINLSIAAGDFLAILGRSGCGKSSLAAILAGLNLPSDGAVLIDGRPYETLDRTALRRSASFVNQNSHLFAGSIRDNILMSSPTATQEDLETAARLAEIHDDVMTLPMGYDTLLGTGGSGVSGGQRQRIALARALVRRPGLLILDEATSALDIETEARIFANLLTLDCTLVVIAHRLATLSLADQVLVLEEGSTAHLGGHAELSRDSRLYADLLGANSVNRMENAWEPSRQ